MPTGSDPVGHQGVSVRSPRTTALYKDTTAHTGLNVFCIVPLTDATFTTLTGLTGDSYASVTFPAGIPIYGPFTAITLATGTVLAHTQ